MTVKGEEIATSQRDKLCPNRSQEMLILYCYYVLRSFHLSLDLRKNSTLISGISKTKER